MSPEITLRTQPEQLQPFSLDAPDAGLVADKLLASSNGFYSVIDCNDSQQSLLQQGFPSLSLDDTDSNSKTSSGISFTTDAAQQQVLDPENGAYPPAGIPAGAESSAVPASAPAAKPLDEAALADDAIAIYKAADAGYHIFRWADKDGINKILQDKTDAEREEISKLYQEKFGVTLDDEIKKFEKGSDLDTFENIFHRKDDNPISQDAGRIHEDLMENHNWGGRSHTEIEKDIRDTLSTHSPQELSQMDSVYKQQYGISLSDAIAIDSELSQTTKDMAQIYLTGKHNDADTSRLIDIALNASSYSLKENTFEEVMRDASAAARKNFMDNGGADRLQAAFGQSSLKKFMEGALLGPLGSAMINSSYQKALADVSDYATEGKLDASTQVRENTGVVFSNSKGIELALDRMTNSERQEYMAGKMLESGKSVDGLSADDQSKARAYYDNLHGTLAKVANATDLVKYEDMIASGGKSSFVGSLSSDRGRLWNSSVADIGKQIASMSKQDWQDSKEHPERRDALQEMLQSLNKNPAQIADLLKQYDDKLAPDSYDKASPPTDIVSTLNALPRNLVNEGCPTFGSGLWSNVVSSVEMAAQPGSAGWVEKANTNDVVQAVEKAFKDDPSLQNRILHPQTDDDKSYAAAFQKSLQSALVDDYEAFGKPLVETGRLPLELQTSLEKGLFSTDTEKVFQDVASATPEERSRLLDDSNYKQEVLGSLSKENQQIALNIASQGSVNPEDKIRSEINGWGGSSEILNNLKSIKPDDLQKVSEAYAGKYGSSFEGDIMAKLSGSDRTEAESLLSQDLSSETRINIARTDTESSRSGVGAWMSDNVFRSGTGAQADDTLNQTEHALKQKNDLQQAIIDGNEIMKNLTPEQQVALQQQVAEQLNQDIKFQNEAEDNHVEAKKKAGEYVGDAAIATAAIGAMIITGGAASVPLVASLAAIGAGVKVGANAMLQGNDYDWSVKNVAKDSLVGAVMGATAVIGPGQVADLLGIGASAAGEGTALTVAALAQAGMSDVLEKGGQEILEAGTKSIIQSTLASGASKLDQAAFTALANKAVAESVTGAARDKAVALIAGQLEQNVSERMATGVVRLAAAQALNSAGGALGGSVGGFSQGALNWDSSKTVSENLEMIAKVTEQCALTGAIAGGATSAAITGGRSILQSIGAGIRVDVPPIPAAEAELETAGNAAVPGVAGGTAGADALAPKVAGADASTPKVAAPEASALTANPNVPAAPATPVTGPTFEFRKAATVKAEVAKAPTEFKDGLGNTVKADAGDILLTEPWGRVTSVKPDVFNQTYAEVPGKPGEFFKPAISRAQQLQSDTVVNTPEGIGTGKRGDWLVTGPNGEKSIVPALNFNSLYKAVETPVTSPTFEFQKAASVKAEVAKEAFDWKDWQGNTMHAEAGDMKVTQPDGSISSVKPDIFKQTYSEVPGKPGEFAKTAITRAQQLQGDTAVNTLEGIGTGKKGDWLVTGPKGEQYIVAGDKFNQLYKAIEKPVTSPTFEFQKAATVKAEVAKEAFDWKDWQGNTMHAEAGDMKVTQPDGSISSVKPDIFKQTYSEVPSKPGEFAKTAITRAQQLQGDTAVNTLEGIGTGKKGDWLVTGPKGEQYIVAGEKFNQLYKAVEKPVSGEGPATGESAGISRTVEGSAASATRPDTDAHLFDPNSPFSHFDQVDESVYRSGRPRGQEGLEEAVENVWGDEQFDPEHARHTTIVDLRGDTKPEKAYAKAAQAELTEEEMNAAEMGITRTRFPVQNHESPDPKFVQSVLDYIDQQKASGNRVLIHCFHGTDRTGLISAAYKLTHDPQLLQLVKDNPSGAIESGLKSMTDNGFSQELRPELAQSLKDFVNWKHTQLTEPDYLEFPSLWKGSEASAPQAGAPAQVVAPKAGAPEQIAAPKAATQEAARGEQAPAQKVAAPESPVVVEKPASDTPFHLQLSTPAESYVKTATVRAEMINEDGFKWFNNDAAPGHEWQIANKGDYKIYPPDGGPFYVADGAYFRSAYHDMPGYPGQYAKSVTLDAQKLEGPASVNNVTQGVTSGGTGDYLVTDAKGNQYIVPKATFEAQYAPQASSHGTMEPMNLPPETSPPQDMGGGVLHSTWAQGDIIRDTNNNTVMVQNSETGEYQLYRDGRLTEERRVIDSPEGKKTLFRQYPYGDIESVSKLPSPKDYNEALLDNQYQGRTLGAVKDEAMSMPDTLKDTAIDKTERAALQRAAVNDRWNKLVSGDDDTAKKLDLGPPKQEKKARILIGLTGSGKTTAGMADLQGKGYMVLESDELKPYFPEYKGGIGAGALRNESNQLNDELLARAIKNGYNFVLPGVGTNAQWMEQTIKTLHDAGWDVDLTFVDIPPSESMTRVVNRFTEHGRFVDPGFLVTHGNVPAQNYRKVVDDMFINGSGLDSYKHIWNYGKQPVTLEEGKID